MVTDRALPVYSMGTVFWNDLSPAYFSDVRVTCNKCWSLHLNCLSTMFWGRNWVRYNEIMLWRALYVKHNALNAIRSCMGNQWSWWRTICWHPFYIADIKKFIYVKCIVTKPIPEINFNAYRERLQYTIQNMNGRLSFAIDYTSFLNMSKAY